MAGKTKPGFLPPSIQSPVILKARTDCHVQAGRHILQAPLHAIMGDTPGSVVGMKLGMVYPGDVFPWYGIRFTGAAAAARAESGCLDIPPPAKAEPIPVDPADPTTVEKHARGVDLYRQFYRDGNPRNGLIKQTPVTEAQRVGAQVQAGIAPDMEALRAELAAELRAELEAELRAELEAELHAELSGEAAPEAGPSGKLTKPE